MDFHLLQGQGISKFSSSSPHRMPTVSAAQALQDLSSSLPRTIPTGLPGLDRLLQNNSSDSPSQHGGVVRGHVTEIYGPPGVGKTAIGVQLAASALNMGQGVIWVDASHPLPGPRLLEVLSSSRPLYNKDHFTSESGNYDANELLRNLVHFSTPSLPQLVTLFCQTTPSFPTSNTSLVIIDSLSILIASTYPRNLDSTAKPGKPGAVPKQEPQSWAQTRKWAVLQYIISCLQKLATLRSIAVVILGQAVTKMQHGARAVLVPAISSTAWDAGISTRIVLFREWGWTGAQVRFASAFKADGVLVRGKDRPGTLVAFTIASHGLEEVQVSHTTFPQDLATSAPRKRKADEIRDSDEEENLHDSEEDYGWAEEDDGELPQPPPQWQGSEDILVPGLEDRGDEDEDELIDSEDEGNGNLVELLTANTKDEYAEDRR